MIGEIMRSIFFCIVIFFVFCTNLVAQDKSLFEKHWYIKAEDTLPYRLLLPQDYDTAKKYPLILFLHGAGERGNNNEAQLVHGASLFLRDSIRKKYPAIVVFPQCPSTSYWSNVQFETDNNNNKRVFRFQEKGEATVAMKMLINLIKEVQQKFNVDKKRYYVGGLSMGGMGTFELVKRNPKMFAAAFPICGGGNTKTANKLRRTNWWIFHGSKDDVVPPFLSQSMATALKQKGADVQLTLYPEANHNSWDAAFAEKNLMPWLFSNHK
jgi:predicted peptidase